MTESSFLTTLTAARAGDDDAAARLVREYESELRRYVRFRLTHPGLRRFLDSLDVCQSVLAAFFVRLQGGQFDLVAPGQLVRLLAVMAEHKVRDKVRMARAVRRGGDTFAPAQLETVQLPAPDPDPGEVAAGRELVELFRERLTDDDRAAVDRWLAGEDWGAIAAALSSTPDAVRKRVGRAIDRAAHELGLLENAP